MSGLTREQSAMLEHCLELNAAWTTSADGENVKLLASWEAKGWTERVKPPARASGLASFRITDAGRAALSKPKPHDETRGRG